MRLLLIATAFLLCCKTDTIAPDARSQSDARPDRYLLDGPCGSVPDALVPVRALCPPVECYRCENQRRFNCGLVCGEQACRECVAGQWRKVAVDCDRNCTTDRGATLDLATASQ